MARAQARDSAHSARVIGGWGMGLRVWDGRHGSREESTKDQTRGGLLKVTIHCLCDAANVAQGMKLNILGAFSHIWVSGDFPFRWPMMTYAARLEVESSDPRQFRVDLRILDEDGQLIGGVEGVTGVIPVAVPPGEVMAMPLLLNIADATFGRAGTVTFELRIDGVMRAETTLFVKPKPEPPPLGS